MALKSRIPRIIASSGGKVALAVERTLARVELGAKKRSRVDTGTMRGGWEVEQSSPFEGMVVNRVVYTIFHEYGTHKMAAQPMLRPSVEEARQEYIREVSEAWR